MGAMNMLGQLGGSAISTAGNIAAQSMANKTNVRLTRETNALNKEIADNANALQRELQGSEHSWLLDMWNRQNEYNTYAADLRRKLDAGLNPLFETGSFGEAQGVASPGVPGVNVPNMHAPQVNPITIPDLGGSVADALRLQNETKKVNSDVEVNSSVIDYNKASVEQINANTELLSQTTKQQRESFPIALQSASQALENLKSQKEHTDADKSRIEALTRNIEEMTKYYAETIQQKWQEILNGRISAQAAKTAAYAASKNAITNEGRLAFDKEKWQTEAKEINTRIQNMDAERLKTFTETILKSRSNTQKWYQEISDFFGGNTGQGQMHKFYASSALENNVVFGLAARWAQILQSNPASVEAASFLQDLQTKMQEVNSPFTIGPVEPSYKSVMYQAPQDIWNQDAFNE